jgi:protein SCO1/2
MKILKATNPERGPKGFTFLSFVLFVSFVVQGAVFAQFTAPLSVPPPGPAASERIPILNGVSIDQKLNSRVPLDVALVDERGQDVRLGEFFGKRPVLLVLAYYDCPMLCSEVLSAMVGSMETLSFNPGRDFEVVVVSFNPGDTPAAAAGKKATYLKRYGRAGTEGGFHFLTGRPESIARLTEAVGFHYAFDKTIAQYAHPAVLHVLTPDGRLSRYLYGIDFPPRDLRLALVEAADGKIGTKVDQFLLYCYHYDPQTGKYGFAILNAVRLGGLLTVALTAMFIVTTLRRERRQAPAAGARIASPRAPERPRAGVGPRSH